MDHLSTLDRPFSTLRRFTQRRDEPKERCELCSCGISDHHQHLINPRNRQIICACDACAMLFPNEPDRTYRRIPRQSYSLNRFQLENAQWDALLIPIGLAFFIHSSIEHRTVALYPSPGGAMESLLDLHSWSDIETTNPIAGTMEPDVQALLINRLGSRYGTDISEYYLAPIDRCYQLVGLIRAHWSGLSGGTEVWRQIESFFQMLRETSSCLN